MALSNIPVNMQGYKLMVTEVPQPKMRENENGELEPAVDRRTNTQQFVVSLFAKKKTQPGEYGEKGEEIKVTLSTDPGDQFEEGTYVQLVDATISPYQSERNGRVFSGISYKAHGLSPVG